MLRVPDLKHLPLYTQSLVKTATLLEMAKHEPKTMAQMYDNGYSTMTEEQAIHDYQLALWALPRSKIFEISPTLIKMLLNTDNAIYPTRLPFSPMFIEAQLEYDMAWQPQDIYVAKQQYLGFMLMEGPPMTKGHYAHLSHLVMEGKELVEKAYPNIFIYAVTHDEVGTGHIRISMYTEYTDDPQHQTKLEPAWEAERDFIRKFIMNFLDFLNDPEVETVHVLRSNRSIRKAIKHGKKPVIRESNIVRVNGKLKHYVDALEKHIATHFHYSHRFWVRGHWKHLTAKRYHKTKCFCPPFIKGEGPLKLDKRYYANQPLPKRHANEGKTTMFREENK